MEIVKTETVSAEVEVRGKFEEFKQQAAEWLEKALTINVTDVTQTDIIAQAAEGRKMLTKARTGVEKRRKELKAFYLEGGRNVDAIAKEITSLIEPAEEHLAAQEKFIEIEARKAEKALQEERAARLRPFLENDPMTLPLSSMQPEAFEMMLKGYQEAHEARERAKKQAEEDRRAQQQADEEKRKKDAEELERLRQLQQKVQPRIDLFRTMGFTPHPDGLMYTLIDGDSVMVKKTDLETASDDEFRESHDIMRVIVDQDVQKKLEIEAERKRQQEEQAERLRKLELEKKEREDKEKADRAAALKLKRAPDKEKLLALSKELNEIRLRDLKLKDEQADKLLVNVQILLAKTIKYINDILFRHRDSSGR